MRPDWKRSPGSSEWDDLVGGGPRLDAASNRDANPAAERLRSPDVSCPCSGRVRRNSRGVERSRRCVCLVAGARGVAPAGGRWWRVFSVLVDIDGDGEAEIFTAGKGMYAWRQDGTAVVGVNPFFEPTDVAGTDQLFVEALAVADIDDDSKFEVVGSVRHRGIFCVELTPSGGTYSATLEWQRSVSSLMSAPVLADLNGNGTLEVLMPSDADTLYVWNSNGTSFNVYDSYGAFARMPSGSTFNFRGVSAAEIDANAGVEIVATTRDGHGYILDPISTQDYAPIRYSLPFPIQEWGSTPVIANLVSGSYKSIIYTTRNLGSGDGGVWVAWPYGQCVEALAYDSWVLAGLDKPSLRRRRSWRTWTEGRRRLLSLVRFERRTGSGQPRLGHWSSRYPTRAVVPVEANVPSMLLPCPPRFRSRVDVNRTASVTQRRLWQTSMAMAIETSPCRHLTAAWSFGRAARRSPVREARGRSARSLSGACQWSSATSREFRRLVTQTTTVSWRWPFTAKVGWYISSI